MNDFEIIRSWSVYQIVNLTVYATDRLSRGFNDGECLICSERLKNDKTHDNKRIIYIVSLGLKNHNFTASEKQFLCWSCLAVKNIF